jgi:hypothetical protein
MARAAGGLEAVPMACNARICSVAAPFHQCSTHGLPGLQSKTLLESKLTAVCDDARGNKKVSAVETAVAQCTRAFAPPLQCRAQVICVTSMRVSRFFSSELTLRRTVVTTRP